MVISRAQLYFVASPDEDTKPFASPGRSAYAGVPRRAPVSETHAVQARRLLLCLCVPSSGRLHAVIGLVRAAVARLKPYVSRRACPKLLGMHVVRVLVMAPPKRACGACARHGTCVATPLRPEDFPAKQPASRRLARRHAEWRSGPSLPGQTAQHSSAAGGLARTPLGGSGSGQASRRRKPPTHPAPRRHGVPPFLPPVASGGDRSYDASPKDHDTSSGP